MVNLVDESVKVPAEMKLLKDAVLELIAGLKQKKSLVELALAELPKLQAAVSGFGALGDEFKSEQAAVALGLMAGQLVSLLMAPAPAAPIA